MPKKPNAKETIVHSVRLNPDEKAWLDEQAEANGLELQQLIRHIVSHAHEPDTATALELIGKFLALPERLC